jgi:hypothetical protein
VESSHSHFKKAQTKSLVRREFLSSWERGKEQMCKIIYQNHQKIEGETMNQLFQCHKMWSVNIQFWNDLSIFFSKLDGLHFLFDTRTENQGADSRKIEESGTLSVGQITKGSATLEIWMWWNWWAASSENFIENVNSREFDEMEVIGVWIE